MAKPRVFVSSTFYDLRHVRNDLERFIRDMGYEPVLHERGVIPYGKEEELEKYAYREVGLSDIVVCIIGGRFGTESTDREHSITQQELRTARDQNKQVYVFVEKGVHAEYNTFLANSDNKEIKWAHVDDPRVYAFLRDIYSLASNNVVFPFESSGDIMAVLREQWAGSFQRFLQDYSFVIERRLIEDMRNTIQTLNEIVKNLMSEQHTTDDSIQKIFLFYHPLWKRLRQVTRNGYRLFFADRKEMGEWLGVRGYAEVPEGDWDDPNYEEWVAIHGDVQRVLRIHRGLYDEKGQIKPMQPSEWQDDFVSQTVTKILSMSPEDEKDLPF